MKAPPLIQFNLLLKQKEKQHVGHHSKETKPSLTASIVHCKTQDCPTAGVHLPYFNQKEN